jgi:hypothetical protein
MKARLGLRGDNNEHYELELPRYSTILMNFSGIEAFFWFLLARHDALEHSPWWRGAGLYVGIPSVFKYKMF